MLSPYSTANTSSPIGTLSPLWRQEAAAAVGGVSNWSRVTRLDVAGRILETQSPDLGAPSVSACFIVCFLVGLYPCGES